MVIGPAGRCGRRSLARRCRSLESRAPGRVRWLFDRQSGHPAGVSGAGPLPTPRQIANGIGRSHRSDGVVAQLRSERPITALRLGRKRCRRIPPGLGPVGDGVCRAPGLCEPVAGSTWPSVRLPLTHGGVVRPGQHHSRRRGRQLTAAASGRRARSPENLVAFETFASYK